MHAPNSIIISSNQCFSEVLVMSVESSVQAMDLLTCGMCKQDNSLVAAL